MEQIVVTWPQLGALMATLGAMGGATWGVSVWMFNVLRADLTSLRTEMTVGTTCLRADMSTLRVELRDEMREVRTTIAGLTERVYGLSERIKGIEACTSLNTMDTK